MQIFMKSAYSTQTLTLTNPNNSQTLLSIFPFNPNSQNPTFFITLDGKPLSLSTSLSKIPNLSTLTLNFTLLGGGGDGGSTCAESRDCYLNMYAEKKPDKIDLNEIRLSKWLNCSISNEPLKKPIVVDFLGNLYNKEKLVEAILMKNLPKELNYVKGLKDMVDIELGFLKGEKGLKFGCSITDLEFNGKYGFFALKKCGHVFSEKAFKLVKSDKCLVCGKIFCENDKIVINGSDDEVRVLRERMLNDKKAKNLKNGAKKVGKVGVLLENGDILSNGNEDVKKEENLSKIDGEKLGFDQKVDFSVKDKIFSNEDVKKEENLSKVDNKKVSSGEKYDSDEKMDNKKVSSGKKKHDFDEKKEKKSGKKHGFDEKLEVDKKGKKRFKAVEALPAGATKEVYASIFTSSRKSDFKETYSCRSLPLGRN